MLVFCGPYASVSLRSRNHSPFYQSSRWRLVNNGDIISIDLEKKTIDLEVAQSVIAERRKGLLKTPEKEQPGWLSIYQRKKGPLHERAVLNRRLIPVWCKKGNGVNRIDYRA
jgi:hypothetical protein